MWTSVVSINPVENDSTWEASRKLVNLEISKLKNFGYKVSKKNFRSRFLAVMEALQLQRAP